MMVVFRGDAKRRDSAKRLPVWAVSILCAAAITLAPLGAESAGTEVFTATSDAEVVNNGAKISIDSRGVDLRDLLSALALKMGINVVLIDTTAMEVNFQAKNVTPRQALELLTQGQGLAYVEQGGVIVVGKQESLDKDFFNQMILTRFDTTHVAASKVIALLGSLGIPLKSVTLDTNTHAFWVQGTVQALQKVQEVVYSVDRAENADSPALDISLEYKTIATTQIPPDRAVKILDDIGIKLKHYVKLGDRVLVFDKDWFSKWDQIDALLSQLDVATSKDQTTFIYQLKNIVAKDAKSRLAEFNLGAEVKAISYNNDKFAKDVLIICPTYLEKQVRSALADLDLTVSKSRVPVASSESFSGLNTERTLLSELSGIPLSHFNISGNVGTSDVSNGSAKYVLWLEETPDRIQMVKDLVGEMK